MTQGETFLRYVLDQLVEGEGSYTMEAKEDEQGVLYTVYMAPAEMGKIIGKGGRHVEALKTLLKMIGSKENTRLSLKVLERTDI